MDFLHNLKNIISNGYNIITNVFGFVKSNFLLVLIALFFGYLFLRLLILFFEKLTDFIFDKIILRIFTKRKVLGNKEFEKILSFNNEVEFHADRKGAGKTTHTTLTLAIWQKQLFDYYKKNKLYFEIMKKNFLKYYNTKKQIPFVYTVNYKVYKNGLKSGNGMDLLQQKKYNPYYAFIGITELKKMFGKNKYNKVENIEKISEIFDQQRHINYKIVYDNLIKNYTIRDFRTDNNISFKVLKTKFYLPYYFKILKFFELLKIKFLKYKGLYYYKKNKNKYYLKSYFLLKNKINLKYKHKNSFKSKLILGKNKIFKLKYTYKSLFNFESKHFKKEFLQRFMQK